MHTKSTLPTILALVGIFLGGPRGSYANPGDFYLFTDPVTTPGAVVEPIGNLTLPKALALALTRNPSLAAFSKEIRAREAAVLQAGLLPNPTLDATAENFGNNSLRGFDGEAVTVNLSQLIELGGQRAARIEAAEVMQELGGWDYEVQRIEILANVAKSFVEVLSAQAQLDLVHGMAKLAEQVSYAVSNQIAAGKVSPIEKTRSEVSLASARVQLSRVEKQKETARNRLSGLWGSTKPRFIKVLGQLEVVSPLPTLAQLEQRIENNPELERWSTEFKQRQAAVNLEKAKAVPNLTVSLGVRHFFDPKDSSLVAGLSIPLPLFDRNQGAILEAEYRRSSADDERRAAEVRIGTALHTVYHELSAAYSEVQTYAITVLPAAELAFNTVEKGYRLGKFRLLDVLDTQRTFFKAKRDHIRALTTYHHAVTDLERLTGTRIFEDPK